MKNGKKRLIIVIAIVVIIALGYAAINTSFYKPSLGSRLARLTIRMYLAPAFGDRDFVQAVRKSLDNISKLTILPRGTRVEQVDLAGLKGELVSAGGVDPKGKKVILYLHGGAFFAGSPATHRELAARISAASGLPALVPDYRLAPEHTFPAASDDCLAAYRWLLARGYESKNIAIGGDSAGGCLAMMTVLSLRDARAPLPAAVFLLSPLTDAVNFDGESMKTRDGIDPWFNPRNMEKHMAPFTGGLKVKPPILSPVRANLRGLPPMLIQVGSDEILLSDSTRLAERAKQAGVDVSISIWDGLWHDFQTFAVIVPEGRRAINDIGEFLKTKMK
jgi:epsilon-lactone hydrolase